MTSIYDLDTLCWTQILSFLDTRSQLRWIQTCRLFRSLKTQITRLSVPPYVTDDDLEGFEGLQFLECYHSRIGKSVVSNMPHLVNLYCSKWEVISQDWSALTGLTSLTCWSCEITELKNITCPTCSDCHKIKDLGLHQLPNLVTLRVTHSCVSRMPIGDSRHSSNLPEPHDSAV